MALWYPESELLQVEVAYQPPCPAPSKLELHDQPLVAAVGVYVHLNGAHLVHVIIVVVNVPVHNTQHKAAHSVSGVGTPVSREGSSVILICESNIPGAWKK